jgi:hypothetical protein
MSPLLFVAAGVVLIASGFFLDDHLPSSYFPDACMLVGFALTFGALAFWVLS